MGDDVRGVGWRVLELNVLLVENDELMAQPLRRAGQAVTVASSSEEARRLAATGSFDAVVLGRIQPEAASLTVCSDLRREGASTPILLLVGRDTSETRVQGLDAGADDCVALSSPVEELLARLRALVRRSATSRPTA
jgi:DNA-binding response OmpR family regulator